MPVLTAAARAALRDEQFAIPTARKIPIHDADHVRTAWPAISSTKGLTTVQRRTARNLTIAAAKALGVETEIWEASLASGTQKWGRMDISAMALNISNDDDHPNKMPFSGVLTYIGRPSDHAPHGSAGRMVMISAEAAKTAIPSLLGMAVNYRPAFDGHDAQEKIGLITEATIDGDKIRISGFIYAADYPEAADSIQAMKDQLGFSFEAKRIVVKDMDADLLEIESMSFTGASILLKDKAAYLNTSLAASAEQEENEMTPEQAATLEAIAKALPGIAALSASVADLTTKVNQQAELSISAANLLNKVEPHAKSLEATATALEAAGIGSHAVRGHATILRNMASTMRASAVMGSLPSQFDGMYFAADPAELDTKVTAAVEAKTKELTDKLGAAATELSDLKASATTAGFKVEGNKIVKIEAGAAAAAGATARKSVPSALMASAEQTLKKVGLAAPGEGEMIEVTVLDKALKDANVFGVQAMAAKTSLARAGLIA